MQIILFNEQNLNEFKRFIRYNIVKDFCELSKEKKKSFLEQNIDDIYNFCLYYDGVIKSQKISFIKNYNDCLNEIKKENKFYILRAKNKIVSKLVKQNIIDKVFYYENKKESFIIFTDKNKRFKLKELENNFWELIEYEETTIEIINIFNDEIKSNKKQENIKKYLYKIYKDFKEFYLINENWLNCKLNKIKQNVCSIKLEYKKTGFTKKNYPIEFGFLEKQVYQELMNKLLKLEKNINNKDLYYTKIFFVYANNNTLNNKNNKIYIGILDRNIDQIYFYTFRKESYIKEFIIEYTKNNIILDEINNKILLDGIETYLYNMGIDLLSKENMQNIINIELENVGIFINLNENREYNVSQIHSRSLAFTNTNYYNGVIQCLVNIGPLRDIFFNRNKLIKNNIIQDYKKITKNFYLLIQDMWNSNIYSNDKNNKDNNNGESSQSLIFVFEIAKYKIFNDIKSLIGFLLLSMHFEQKLKNKKDSIQYDLNKFEKSMNGFNEKETSFISELFFFKLSNIIDNKYTINYMLNIDIDNKFFKSEKEYINISSLFSCQNIHIIFNNKVNLEIAKIKLEKSPKILIIFLKYDPNQILKLYCKEKITIKEIFVNSKKNIDGKYELISYIQKDNINVFKTYCKSLIQKEIWYVFTEVNSEQSINSITSNKEMLTIDNPYLLIFQQC